MRILQVDFENLNSLAGRWKIDFRAPEFVADGIFSITGPTGAGKTTILDAICLALYGQTPRLGKITKSGNEIISRHTGNCFAEVMFETQSGRYICHWSQRRARDNAEGELQAQKHEISNAESGAVLESNITGVAARVESVTGMDFDRFTRSMMLAQGEFSKFLYAGANEKGPILEQITGTDIYTRISIYVHERQRAEEGKLSALNQEISGIEVMDAEQEQEAKQNLESKKKEEQEISVKFKETEKARDWLRSIASLKGELDKISNDESTLQTEIKDFAPDRKDLEWALKAAKLEGPYGKLEAIRSEQTGDVEQLESAQGQLPEVESFAKQQVKLLQDAEKKAGDAKAELQKAAPLLKQVRALDDKIHAKEESIEALDEECGEIKAGIEHETAEINEAKGNIAGYAEQLDEISDYLAENKAYEKLVSGYSGIEAQLNGLRDKHNAILGKQQEKQEAADALAEAKKALDDGGKASIEKSLASVMVKTEQGNKALKDLLGDRHLREFRADRDALLREMGLKQKIIALEDERKKLKDGEPCPVCGALDHPYAKGNVPTLDETERKIENLGRVIKQAEKIEGDLAELAISEKNIRADLTACEKDEVKAKANKQAIEGNIKKISTDLASLNDAFSNAKSDALKKLEPYEIKAIPDSKIEAILDKLAGYADEWNEAIEEKREVEAAKAEAETAVKNFAKNIEKQSGVLTKKRASLTEWKRELTEMQKERGTLFGSKDPDAVEEALNEVLSAAEAGVQAARGKSEESQKNLTSLQANIKSLNSAIAKRKPELEKIESSFLQSLTAQGLTTEKHFHEVRLERQAIDELSKKADELDRRHIAIKASKDDRQKKLAEKTAEKITDASLEETENLFNQQESLLQETRDSISRLDERIKNNEDAKKKIAEKKSAIEAQEREFARWDVLRLLIGSRDGQKYRNFAQGLTFDILIKHANHQLRKMTDRYLLIRDDEKPLELAIIDNYQAGEIRSTKNLSGGEGFIVSLSLALGLSNMASKKVRVDSLFLDEGFGTLDEDALDTALDTLAGLQHEGKLIGVISHVQALKERISTQIMVEKKTGGRSKISGPGCGVVN